MDTPARRLPPLVAAAMVSIILFCAAGIAAIVGILPAGSQPADTAAKAAAPLTETRADPPPLAPVRDPAPRDPSPPPQIVQQPEAAVPAPVAQEPVQPKARSASHHATAHHHELADASAYAPAASTPACVDCGTVVAVNPVVTQGQTSGLGAVGGAVVGGVAGHQFGNGHGQQAMTALGAIGGALAGNQIEKQRRQTTSYNVVVRMEDGSERTVNFASAPGFNSGEHVRVQNGTLIHAGQ